MERVGGALAGPFGWYYLMEACAEHTDAQRPACDSAIDRPSHVDSQCGIIGLHKPIWSEHRSAQQLLPMLRRFPSHLWGG
jgi:hypothetical protein